MTTALVVEDSLTDKEIITGFLQGNGISFIVAQSAAEAFEKVKNNQFDLIILDVVLPDRSGFEICRDFKTEMGTGVPVIICSTKGTEIDKFWGMKQGADAYLTKPVDQKELIETIQKLLVTPNN
ncbi:MAG: response regulator [Leptolyngbya sp. SIO1D8]|nr:response regulator [Leptolyngbya sp. SIO1D8]